MKKYVLLAACCLFAQLVLAQLRPSDSVYKKIVSLDSLVFEEGFNKCNHSFYDEIIAEDLEFYHDLGGITQGRADFIRSVKNNICGGKEKMKRSLDHMKVYPLKDKGKIYGAVQEGLHSFYIRSKNDWTKTGSARFVHLWLYDGTHWQLKRVLSYNH
ncbi:nuclear transport factor 2 family protein [Taibaiella chishuiensis]|uniref:Uncharacterized protein DUF4440 n=1 Tax=Taibaiella chishuiensis TaxID=1434707 RepID=A0A2P8DB06_9BACT|nr:nuclear transport factor 2 family protein [Taibaiella chishuiensis]PSK94404.1 uncharacterized protein DUF4440 [Taibaiella chishuiensis]